MCFRPPDAVLKVLKCPECGKRINNPVYRPENCPYCGAYLPPELDGMDKVLADNPELAASVGMAPSAPKAPPSASAPKVPGGPPAVKPVATPAVTPVSVKPVATPVVTPIPVKPVTTPAEEASS